MSDNYLFRYGKDETDNPRAAVLVPEGMSTGDFIFEMGDSLKNFVEAFQEAHDAVSGGNLRQADNHLGTLLRLNESYAKINRALRGIPKHNQYFMAVAIANHLEQDNKVTDDVRKYAEKYNVLLE